jgi:hypothetical protein
VNRLLLATFLLAGPVLTAGSALADDARARPVKSERCAAGKELAPDPSWPLAQTKDAPDTDKQRPPRRFGLKTK